MLAVSTKLSAPRSTRLSGALPQSSSTSAPFRLDELICVCDRHSTSLMSTLCDLGHDHRSKS